MLNPVNRNLIKGLGLLFLVVAGVAWSIARKPAPAAMDLTWHQGAVVSPKEVELEGRALVFGVAGLAKAFRHDADAPAYDTLKVELVKGAAIRVRYDPAQEGRWTRAWSVQRNGSPLLTYVQMKAWDDDKKSFGFVLAIVMGVLGLALTVLGFRAKRKEA